jgi:hypothetical protein
MLAMAALAGSFSSISVICQSPSCFCKGSTLCSCGDGTSGSVVVLMVIAVNFSCGCLCCVSLVSMNSSLTIFNWNVRGLNSVVRREEVLKLLQSSRL